MRFSRVIYNQSCAKKKLIVNWKNRIQPGTGVRNIQTVNCRIVRWQQIKLSYLYSLFANQI